MITNKILREKANWASTASGEYRPSLEDDQLPFAFGTENPDEIVCVETVSYWGFMGGNYVYGATFECPNGTISYCWEW